MTMPGLLFPPGQMTFCGDTTQPPYFTIDANGCSFFDGPTVGQQIGDIKKAMGTYGLMNFQSYCVATSPVRAMQTAGITVLSYAPPSAGMFKVGAWLGVTAIVTDVLEIQVGWTDVNGNAQTVNLIAGVSATRFYTMPDLTIFSKGHGTAITVNTILTTGGGTITYDVGAFIQDMN